MEYIKNSSVILWRRNVYRKANYSELWHKNLFSAVLFKKILYYLKNYNKYTISMPSL